MKRKSVSTRHKHQCQFWLEVIPRSCFVLLFGFFSFFNSVSALADAHQEHLEARDSGVHVDGHLAIAPPQSNHLPFGPVPVPLEPEAPSESESSEEVNDEIAKLCWDLGLEKNYSRSAEQRLLLQAMLSIESRSKVSLFVLHHSWKSFLN